MTFKNDKTIRNINLIFEIEESKYFFLELFIEYALGEASCETLTFFYLF